MEPRAQCSGTEKSDRSHEKSSGTTNGGLDEAPTSDIAEWQDCRPRDEDARARVVGCRTRGLAPSALCALNEAIRKVVRLAACASSA